MATPTSSTGNTAASALPAAGGTSESTISNWAGPYITNMLGKAQAVANEPYQVYQGPMTAGESGLQNKVFQGLGNLSFPGNLGQSFSSPIGNAARAPGSMQDMLNQGSNGFGDFGSMQATTGLQNQGPAQPGGTYEDYIKSLGMAQVVPDSRETWQANQDQLGQQRQQGIDMLGRGNMSEIMAGLGGQPGQMPQGGLASLAGRMPQQPQASQQPSNIAQSYMNPYLQAVLNPQMDELRRQNAITNMQANAKLTGAGGFGGGRQAIMNAENNRNLMQEMNKTVGQGYASAYDKGMGQFNIEQGQSKDLVNMLANAGQAQRGIEQEGITADYNEFLAQRDDPMKKTQYLQSMLQGLPYQTVTNSPLGKSGMGQLAEITGSLPSVEKTLKELGLIPT